MAAVALVVLVALLLRLQVREEPSEQLPAVANASWISRGETLSGGQPRDLDFLNLRDIFGVAGVVNLRTNGSIEGWVVRDFRMAYLWVPVPLGGAPDPESMQRIVQFADAHATGGHAVFIHDGEGDDRVRPVSVMLLLAQGEPLSVAVERVTGTTSMEAAGFTSVQRDRVAAFAERIAYPGPVHP